MIIVYLMVRGTALPVRGFVFDRLPALGTGRLRPGVIAAAAAITAGLLLIVADKWVDAITTSLIFGIVLLSIVTVTGLCGQISLGQWAIAGMGAFIAARLVATIGRSLRARGADRGPRYGPARPGVRAPGRAARGVNLAIVTLGLGIAVQNIVFNNWDWNGGIGGTVMGSQTFLGIPIDRIDHPETYGILVLVCFASLRSSSRTCGGAASADG